jgi:ATP-dependent protease HslVU (ClpYQ) ATPase subunit
VRETNYETLQTQLCETIEEIFKEEQKRLLNRLNRTTRLRTPIKIQIDEQHSRSQRNDSAATAVFIFKVDEIDKIIHLSHTSSNEVTQQQIKCKAKACRNSGLDFLAKNLKSIHTLIVNGCSSGPKSINDSM